MNKKTEIQCLSRLNEISSAHEDIIAYLLDENLVDKTTLSKLRMSPEKPKEVWTILNNLKQNGKLQLLEYEWVILPVERINILIVTNSSSKTFSHNF